MVFHWATSITSVHDHRDELVNLPPVLALVTGRHSPGQIWQLTTKLSKAAVSGSYGGYFWLGAERRPIDTGSPEHRWFWFTTGAQNGDLNNCVTLTVKRIMKSQNQIEWTSWHTGHS